MDKENKKKTKWIVIFCVIAVFVFCLLFFRPPSPGGKSPQMGANLPDWGRWSTPTHRRAHRASQRPTRGRYQVPSIHPICIPVKSSFSCS